VSFSGSISNWIEGVKAGCETAATSLWARYRSQLMLIARRRLLRSSATVVDEEDIANDAFHSFLRRCRAGDYPEISDRDDLGRLLVAITLHKANNQVRAQQRDRRDVRRTAGEQGNSGGRQDFAFEQLVSPDPPAELLAVISDSLDKIFSILPDGEIRSMVLYRLEGYSNDEIAERIGRSVPTVERRMRLVREIWRREFGDESTD
jgi:RNA polymerase sigma factor (sigma-70 family)